VAKKISRKELAHDEFVDAAFDFGHWLEKHWRSLFMAVGAAVLIVIAVLVWIAWSRQADEKARTRLASGISVYQTALCERSTILPVPGGTLHFSPGSTVGRPCSTSAGWTRRGRRSKTSWARAGPPIRSARLPS
jgi:hypothetical protein